MSLFWARMIAIDNESLAIAVLMCGWGFMIMRSMVSQPLLALASFPLMVFSAVASRTFFADSYFILALDRGYGIALTTGFGMIASVIVLIVLVRIWLLFKDLTGRQPELLRNAQPIKTQLR